MGFIDRDGLRRSLDGTSSDYYHYVRSILDEKQ